MKPVNLLIALVLSLVFSCQTESQPFETQLFGNTIRFPKSAVSLRDSGLVHPDHYTFVDSNKTSKVMWLMSIFDYGEDTIYKLPDQRMAFGVNIYLRNKGNQLDSIKTVLEQQFGTPLLPVTRTNTKGEPVFGSDGYMCQLNKNTTLFLRRATDAQGDSWGKYNSLRVAIGYNLSNEEQERFAFSSQWIYPARD